MEVRRRKTFEQLKEERKSRTGYGLTVFPAGDRLRPWSMAEFRIVGRKTMYLAIFHNETLSWRLKFFLNITSPYRWDFPGLYYKYHRAIVNSKINKNFIKLNKKRFFRLNSVSISRSGRLHVIHLIFSWRFYLSCAGLWADASVSLEKQKRKGYIAE